jgi:signal transduction histidine kinase
MPDQFPDSTSAVSHTIRRHRVAATVAAIGFGVSAVAMASPTLGDDLVPPYVMVALLTSSTMFLRGASRFDDRERQAWTLLGIAYVLAFLGVFGGGVLFAITHSTPAFGGPDLLILSGYVVSLVAFARFPHVNGAVPDRVRVLVDGTVGAVALGTILWVWFLSDLFADLSSASVFDRFVGMAYPIVDLSMVAVISILILRRTALQFDLRLVPFGIAMAIQSYGDLTFVLNGAGRQFADAAPTWWVFSMSTALYVVAAMTMHQRPVGKELPERDLSWLPMLAPYVPAAILIGMLTYRTIGSKVDGDLQVMVAAALLVGIGVVVRQIVSIRENRDHVENERRALISSISHELRTPLTAMVGFLDVLTDENLELPDEDRIEMIDVVKDQAGYMASIVSDMVLLARGRLNQMNIKESTVRVADVIAKAERTLEGNLGAVTVEVDPDLYARLDADRIQQVIVNYLSNAYRYGGPTVEVVVTTKGDNLRLEVHDAGPGVPRRYELTIWGRFERGANRFNASVPGSGIGLAIVQSIATAHGGAADYRRSERLHGACFGIALPGRVAVEATDAARLARVQLSSLDDRMVG